jgi:hypothetical protein
VCDAVSLTSSRPDQFVYEFLLVNTTPQAHDYFYFLLDDGDEMKGELIQAVRTCDVPA